jgi:hypothetical protein
MPMALSMSFTSDGLGPMCLSEKLFTFIILLV